MSLRRSRIAIAAAMSSSLLAGLAIAESSGASTSDTTLPVAGEGPVGVIAIGHSGLTGENSDADRPFQRALENSWATGTNPEVNSVYLRLVEVRPETKGHVANTADAEGVAATLAYQASRAMGIVPTPELVIIQTIDYDIQCPLADADHFRQFGESIAHGLDEIVAASPQSRILMVGLLGRPTRTFLEQLLAAHPELASEFSGTGPCVYLDTTGEVIEENIDGLVEIIESYEAEQQRRCDAVPQCRTDGGVRATYAETLDDLSSDFYHLNVRGQAQAAEIIWPVVADLLGLEDGTTSAVSSTELES
jgi:hypothetical protein